MNQEFRKHKSWNHSRCTINRVHFCVWLNASIQKSHLYSNRSTQIAYSAYNSMRSRWWAVHTMTQYWYGTSTAIYRLRSGRPNLPNVCLHMFNTFSRRQKVIVIDRLIENHPCLRYFSGSNGTHSCHFRPKRAFFFNSIAKCDDQRRSSRRHWTSTAIYV